MRLTDQEIEQAFIARRALLASLLSDLAAENDARVRQHHLIVDQRGMGKTTRAERTRDDWCRASAVLV